MTLELTPIVIVQIIACFLMVFFWGMSMERMESTREKAKSAKYFFLIVAWICILIR